MDENDIRKLFVLLKDNGDKILDGSNKLSLSVDLLYYLIENFNLIVDPKVNDCTSFEVINTSNSKSELFRNLQFLHDFIQKTIGLKICPGIKNKKLNCAVDISKFRSLKLLELNKVCLENVIGIKNIRSQLNFLICVRCLKSLDDIIICCGGDESSGFVWSELKEAVFNHNNIKHISRSTLEYIPWIQMLDLSHNCLKDVQVLDCLSNLKYLNLNYNKIENVPLFSPDQSKNVQVLLLKSNYIEDLSGLVSLTAIRELDVSCNCLVEHSSLSPLPSLITLQWLCVEGNPLSFHPQHRILTARHLHSKTSSVKFILDGSYLSKNERLQVGTFHTNSVRLSEYIRARKEQASSSNTPINLNKETQQRFQSSRHRVRQAVISEQDDDGQIIDNDLMQSCGSISSLELSIDHLETKKQIESLRRQFGDKWLHSQGGSLVQDVLGIEKTPLPVVTSTPKRDSIASQPEVSGSPQSSKTLVQDPDQVADASSSDFSTADTIYSSARDLNTSDDGFYESVDSTIKINDDEDEDGEDIDEQLYIVEEELGDDNIEQSFLCISLNKNVIRERSAATAKVKLRWPLSILISCERTKNGVEIVFDTVKRDKKLKNYIMEDSEAQKLVTSLGQILSSRTLQELNQTIYHCMKCSLQFSQENNSTAMQKYRMDAAQIVLMCPSCNSTLVIEQEDEKSKLLLPKISPPDVAECALPSSPSNASIGSAASLEESTSSHISGFDSQARRADSDIEVLSEPSQDSIEVLNVQERAVSTTSSINKPCEEKIIITGQMLQIPEIKTSPTIVNVMTGLTESSSSDSMTDSVCTSYETNALQAKINEVKQSPTEPQVLTPVTAEVVPSSNSAVSTFSSMLEGLIQGSSKKSSPAQNSTMEKMVSAEPPVEFSYTNFTQVDHRVKLHLYVKIFEDEHEELVWLLRAQILPQTSDQTYIGCVILSTRKIYFMKIIEKNMSEEPSQWLIKCESFTVDRLQMIYTLPWKQGIGIKIRQPVPIASSTPINNLCFLQDLVRTSDFLTFLANSPLPGSCMLQCAVSETIMLKIQQLLLSSASQPDSDPTARLMCVFTKCEIVIEDKTNIIDMGAILISSCDLVLIEGNLTWMRPDSKIDPAVFRVQPMSNLIEVAKDDNVIILNYLDETASREEVWKITLETNICVDSITEAVRRPWEILFSVPLQLTILSGNE